MESESLNSYQFPSLQRRMQKIGAGSLHLKGSVNGAAWTYTQDLLESPGFLLGPEHWLVLLNLLRLLLLFIFHAYKCCFVGLNIAQIAQDLAKAFGEICYNSTWLGVGAARGSRVQLVGIPASYMHMNLPNSVCMYPDQMHKKLTHTVSPIGSWPFWFSSPFGTLTNSSFRFNTTVKSVVLNL